MRVLECEKYIEKWRNFTHALKMNDFLEDDKLIFIINIFYFMNILTKLIEFEEFFNIILSSPNKGYRW